MAWIKSNQNLERNPKLLELMRLMKWDIDTAIGKLHRLWWWVTDYAPDGDLRKWGVMYIAQSCSVLETDAEKFLESMISTGFIDVEPYLRIHDWWDHAGSYLQIRYRDKSDKWRAIRALYEDTTGNTCGNTGADIGDIGDKKEEIEEIYRELTDAWNITELPKIVTWSASRREKLMNRLKDKTFKSRWREVIERLAMSDFALGKGPPRRPGEKSWIVTIDWIIENDTNFIKVLEGKYDNRQGRTLTQAQQNIAEGLRRVYERYGAPKGSTCENEYNTIHKSYEHDCISLPRPEG